MDEVVQLALRQRHWSPTQIHRAVNDGATPELVSLRTVQRVVTDVRNRDESGDWALEDGEPEDIRVLLPVVRWLAEHKMGRPSKNEARWMARLLRAFPKLQDNPELLTYLAVYATRGEPLQGMAEQVLMYAPWEDDATALGDAFAQGLVPFGVMFAFGFERAAANAKRRHVMAQKEGQE